MFQKSDIQNMKYFRNLKYVRNVTFNIWNVSKTRHVPATWSSKLGIFQKWGIQNMKFTETMFKIWNISELQCSNMNSSIETWSLKLEIFQKCGIQQKFYRNMTFKVWNVPSNLWMFLKCNIQSMKCFRNVTLQTHFLET